MNYGMNKWNGKLTKRGVNKTSKETKELVNRILFNEDEFVADWKQMDVRERMEIRIKMAKFIIPEPREAPISNIKEDYPLFVDSKEDADAWRLLQMTENGDTEQVGGSIVFE